MPDPRRAGPEVIGPVADCVERSYRDVVSLEVAITANELDGWAVSVAGRRGGGYWARYRPENPRVAAHRVV